MVSFGRERSATTASCDRSNPGDHRAARTRDGGCVRGSADASNGGLAHSPWCDPHPEQRGVHGRKRCRRRSRHTRRSVPHIGMGDYERRYDGSDLHSRHRREFRHPGCVRPPASGSRFRGHPFHRGLERTGRGLHGHRVRLGSVLGVHEQPHRGPKQPEPRRSGYPGLVCERHPSGGGRVRKQPLEQPGRRLREWWRSGRDCGEPHVEQQLRNSG